MIRTLPVSYTHLDVYKRQPYNEGKNNPREREGHYNKSESDRQPRGRFDNKQQYINTVQFTPGEAGPSRRSMTPPRGRAVTATTAKKKYVNLENKIEFLNDLLPSENVNILLPDLRKDLLQEDDEIINKQVLKCPEITIKFNNDIIVQALLDTGCLINGLSETWFNNHKKSIGPVSYTHLDVYKRQGTHTSPKCDSYILL